MADVRPFRGIVYSVRAGDMAELICPPYDVISPAEQKALYTTNPHNMVRLEFAETFPTDTQGNNRYTRTAQVFRQWLDLGVLRRQEHPAFYLVDHGFHYEGAWRHRQDLIACVRLEELDKGIILPHEETRQGPKQDRLALMEACKANFSPIMALYHDPSSRTKDLLARMRQIPPDIDLQWNDESFAVWVVDAPNTLREISVSFRGQPLYLADGHHRYETALWYRDALCQRYGPGSDEDACNYIMMTIIDFSDPGLLVLPYHRLVGELSLSSLDRLIGRLKELFTFHVFSSNDNSLESAAGALAESVERAGQQGPAIGLMDQGRLYILTLAPESKTKAEVGPGGLELLRRWEGWVLQEKVFRSVLGDAFAEHVSYVHLAQEAAASVSEGRQQLAFLMRPMPLDLFRSVVSAGLRLPPKSTFFHPKVPAGLAINSLEGAL